MQSGRHRLTHHKPKKLIAPYGGELIDLLAPAEDIDALREQARDLPSVQLSERSVCDLELLATGAFSPLDRFMGKDDFERVLEDMRLTTGHIFPVPLTLPVSVDEAIGLDQVVALRDAKNELLALMTVEQIYEWNTDRVAERVYRTRDLRHPLVSEMHRWGKLNISGPLQVLQLPRHFDFQDLRLTPGQTRREMERRGFERVVAFQTRNPLHRVHEELTKRACQDLDAVLLLHPVVGLTKPGDVDHYTRVRTYRALAAGYYSPDGVLLALLPLAMRLAGPREALWHAVIRRNYGANFLIVGRDHASPGLNSKGKAFYAPYEAQKLVEEHSAELGVSVVPFQEMVYLPDEGRFEEIFKVPSKKRRATISGKQIREDYLNNGKRLPDWFTRPEVADILQQAYPPRHRQGFCVWFTGLSGAGKSTTADVLTVLLLERGRQVTVLDGDVVRTHLSKGLGFSKEDRDTNVRRIGFVSSEIVRHGGAVICAAVSPYQEARNDARNMIGGDRFIEVFVDTPLEVCEARDTKGLYAKARQGEIVGFTGIDDPYEIPKHPEIKLDTVDHTSEQNARAILDYLMQQGLIKHEEWEKVGSAAPAPAADSPDVWQEHGEVA